MYESPTASNVFFVYFQTISWLLKHINRYRDVSCCIIRDYVHIL